MNPEMSYASQPAAAPEPAPQNFFSRLIGVWFSPGETFAEIGRAPRVLVPMIVLMILGSVGGYLMIERIGMNNFFKKQFDQAVASGQMSQEDADKQFEAMTSGPAATATRLSFPIIGFIQFPIFALILVGIGKLITMLNGGDNLFKPLYSVTLYTLLATGVVSSILMITILFLKPPDEIDVNNLVGSNLAAVLGLLFEKDALPKFVMAFARWIDIFSIWMLWLLAVGYAAVTKGKKTGSFLTPMAIIYLILALGGAAWAAFRG